MAKPKEAALQARSGSSAHDDAQPTVDQDSRAAAKPDAELVEQQLGRLLDQQDWNGAVELAEQSFGAEIYGYLRAIIRDDTVAEDALQAFRQSLVKGIRSFKRSCEFRIWAYVIAKHEALRILKERRRTRPLESGERDQLPAPATTRDWDLSVNVRKMDCVRARLSLEELQLIVLRVDRNMSWDAIACVISTPDAPVRANALSQQFRRSKAHARDIAADLPRECGTTCCRCGRWRDHE